MAEMAAPPADADADPGKRIGIPYGSREAWGETLEDPGTRARAVASVESLIRTSWEYRRCCAWLRREVRMDACALLRGATGGIVKVELHHHPLTLHDMVDAEFTHLERTQAEFTRIRVAGLVVRHHYDGLAGLVPLSKTMHELAHEGLIAIPPEAVFGNVERYLEMRGSSLSPEAAERAAERLADGRDGKKAEESKAAASERRLAWTSAGGAAGAAEALERLDRITSGIPRGGVARVD